jgi:hypothetical protein
MPDNPLEMLEEPLGAHARARSHPSLRWRQQSVFLSGAGQRLRLAIPGAFVPRPIELGKVPVCTKGRTFMDYAQVVGAENADIQINDA